MLDRARSVRIAAANGILIPDLAWEAARAAQLPYAVACAVLMQESGGGRNIWGHDPTWMVGYGEVTHCAYDVYKMHRSKFGSQGCGPVQLTFWSLQDEADLLGGCWDPYVNCLVGFRLLATYFDALGTWRRAFERYNGSGDAAEQYAAEMVERRTHWRELLA